MQKGGLIATGGLTEIDDVGGNLLAVDLELLGSCFPIRERESAKRSAQLAQCVFRVFNRRSLRQHEGRRVANEQPARGIEPRGAANVAIVAQDRSGGRADDDWQQSLAD